MAPQQGVPPQGGSPNQQGGGLNGEHSVQTEPQLLQNLITKLGVDFPEHANITELGDYLATGFCSQEEIDLIHDIQYDLKQIRRIKRMLGIKESKLTDSEIENVTRMIMISQASKSKGGRGVQSVRTEIVQQMQDLYEKQELGEEEQGMLENIMGKLDGTQVTGQPDAANYQSNQRERRMF